MKTQHSGTERTGTSNLLRHLLVGAQEAEAVALTVVAALRGLDMSETAGPAIALDRCCATPLTYMIERLQGAIERGTASERGVP